MPVDNEPTFLIIQPDLRRMSSSSPSASGVTLKYATPTPQKKAFVSTIRGLLASSHCIAFHAPTAQCYHMYCFGVYLPYPAVSLASYRHKRHACTHQRSPTLFFFFFWNLFFFGVKALVLALLQPA